MDAVELYVDSRLLKDRPQVALHPLLWWLPVVIYTVKDGVNATGPGFRLVPLGSGVLQPSED